MGKSKKESLHSEVLDNVPKKGHDVLVKIKDRFSV